MTELKLKRAYEPESPDDGWRVYIDRLWPRGLSHETFRYDAWDKAVSPTAGLREWFHADPSGRWEGFAAKYGAELAANPGFGQLAASLRQHPVVTLLYSSHDTVRDNSHVLADALVKEYPDSFKLQ